MTFTRNDLHTPQQLERLLRAVEREIATLRNISAMESMVLKAKIASLERQLSDQGNTATGRLTALQGALAQALSVSPADITTYDEETDAWITGDSTLTSLTTSLIPATDDTYDLGSASFQWRNLYIDGTANIDSLVADTADINGGTADNVVIGGATPAAGTFTTVTTNSVSLLKLHYGGMYANEQSETVGVAATDTFYDIAGSMTSGGVTAAFTFQNAHELLCNIAGTYLVNWSLGLQCGTANQGLVGAVGIDATEQLNTTNHSESITASRTMSLSGTGIITLAINEVVTLMVANHTATNDIIMEHANLTLLKIG